MACGLLGCVGTSDRRLGRVAGALLVDALVAGRRVADLELEAFGGRSGDCCLRTQLLLLRPVDAIVVVVGGGGARPGSCMRECRFLCTRKSAKVLRTCEGRSNRICRCEGRKGGWRGWRRFRLRR